MIRDYTYTPKIRIMAQAGDFKGDKLPNEAAAIKMLLAQVCGEERVKDALQKGLRINRVFATRSLSWNSRRCTRVRSTATCLKLRIKSTATLRLRVSSSLACSM